MSAARPASPGATLVSVGMAVPARRVTNAEIAEMVGVEEAWIAKRTGTRERPWAGEGERMSDFAAEAGRQALQRAGLSPRELDLVIVATSSADEISPNAAPLVAGLVGADRAAAVDVSAACTGWLAGLSLGCSQVESGRTANALVIGADFLSRYLDLSDRDTASLFADGAGAAVIDRAGPDSEPMGQILLRADSSGSDHIRLSRGGPIRLNGHEVFRWAVRAMSEVSEEALERAGLTTSDIDLFVYHQANSRIIRAVGERLGLPEDRVIDYVGRFANASTATLPIALTVAEQEGRLHPGDRVLLAAFGGGLTWGATTIVWPGAPPRRSSADLHA